jgi:uncharacterized protein (DUF736 family)
MSDYDNTNSGALFKNERKEADTHADYNGSVNVDGKEFWLNAWLKESKAGKKYMSLSLKQKEVSPAQPQATTISSEDVPF